MPKAIHKYTKALKKGINYLDNFLEDREFFSRRPDLKYVLFDTFAQEMLNHLNKVYVQIPAHALDELLRKEFGSDSAVEAFIFNLLNAQRVQFFQMQYQFNQFAAQAQQRIVELENELKRIKG